MIRIGGGSTVRTNHSLACSPACHRFEGFVHLFQGEAVGDQFVEWESVAPGAEGHRPHWQIAFRWVLIGNQVDELMPRVSFFYGISVYFYYRDHSPPHFHAIYSGHEAEIRIDDQQVLAGGLPPRALGLVREWAASHKSDLVRAWDQARKGQALNPIDPLP